MPLRPPRRLGCPALEISTPSSTHMKITITLVMPSPTQSSREPAVFRWTHNPAEIVRPEPRRKARAVR